MERTYENTVLLRMSTFQYWRSGSEFESAAPQKPLDRCDLVTFLGAAQALKIDFLPITWQPALDLIGQGATAEIRKALMNSHMSFAFKRPKFITLLNVDFEMRVLPFLTAEISILSHPSIRKSPNIVRLEGICWEIFSEAYTFPGEAQFDGTRGGIMPILVFEESKYGDLRNFMTCSVGRNLGLKDKLRLCVDIARAVEKMHSNREFSSGT